MPGDSLLRLKSVAQALSLLVVAWLWAIPLGAAEYDKIVELFAGQTDLLSFDGVTRVSIGNAQLVDVKVLKDTGQILMIAKEPGVTDLRIWHRRGRQAKFLLRILAEAPDAILTKVRAHLEGIEGVQARLAGDRVVIEGQSLREDDFARVKALTEQYQNVSSYVTPGGITMRGMILLDVKVVEVRKSKLKDIGIDWSDVAEGPTFGFLSDWKTNDVFRGTLSADPERSTLDTLDAGTNNVFFGISTRITSIINLLVRNGYAQLLAEPKLTCRSGGEAESLVGGEVPIPASNALGALNVTFKQFGVILKMAPVSDPEGYVATHIEVEVSTIDQAIAVRGIPGFATRRTGTDMNLREGETMVISGLLSSERNKGVDKVPGLGHLPVLGELFKSRQFRNNQTDLVVFVTPYIVDPEHKRNKELLNTAATLQEEAEENLRFRLMD